MNLVFKWGVGVAPPPSQILLTNHWHCLFIHSQVTFLQVEMECNPKINLRYLKDMVMALNIGFVY